MEKEVKLSNSEVELSARKALVKGRKGKLELEIPNSVQVERKKNKLVVRSVSERKKNKAKAGTCAAKLRNAVIGVSRGWEAQLQIVHVHFPISVSKEGTIAKIKNFLGEKTPREARIFPQVEVKIKGSEIKVRGIDKEAVGQTAANFEQATKIGQRDRRKFEDGIYIKEKPKPIS